jgi:hypothetical protein
MPLRATSDGSSDLGPEELPSVVNAFESAIASLELPADEVAAAALRREIAARIIGAAEQGELDPVRLQEIAMGALSDEARRP